MMLLQSHLLKIGNFVWFFGTGEIENERTLDNRYFQSQEFIVGKKKLGNVMTCNRTDSFGLKVYFQFTLIAFGLIKEFDRCSSAALHDKTVLPSA